MIDNVGYTYSDLEKNLNGQRKSFPFTPGSLIYCYFDGSKGTLTIK